MYGLIGKMKTAPGKRDEVISIMLGGVSTLPGCFSYVVAQDPAEEDTIWITEVWDSHESHKHSLTLPTVRDAIARALPMVAGFEKSIETLPVGGHGIQPSK